jgi:ABC-type lipoprotein release transport system permease subunit
MYLILAWRNMWRSRRRTAITVSSVLFAVLFAILMRVMTVGMFEKMIADTVSMTCGYLQIHHSGYWENKTLDSSFEANQQLSHLLNNEKHITGWAPRLESFALASSGNRTKGIAITGIDPARENFVSRLSKKIIAGSYLGDSDKSIILAEGLASYLKLSVNDTVVLMGQGFQGNMAAGKYRIKGIAKLGIPEMNRSMAWLPMQACRDLLSIGPRYTSITILIDDLSVMNREKQALLKEANGENLEIMDWKQMIPELDQFYSIKMGQNLIMSGILYLVIGFGILGTILMMLNERTHEFGILIAIGMKKKILALIVMLEMLIISFTGTVLGMAIAIPIVAYFRMHPILMKGSLAQMAQRFNFEPIIQPSINPSNFLIQGYIVLLISILLSLFAVYKVLKMKVIQALNS